MDKEQSSKLIKDLTFDINDLHDAWYDKKINDALAIEKIVNLCFYFLRTVIDDRGLQGHSSRQTNKEIT